MSYIYGAPIPDVSRSHTNAAQSVGLLWTSDQLLAKTAGRSPTEILGSNPTGGMDICLL
jgi:hypothetical protein